MSSISSPPIQVRRGLRIQLTLALGLLSVLVATISATAIWGMARVSNAASQAMSADGRISGLASQLAIASLENHTMELAYFGTINRPASERMQKELDWLTKYNQLDRAIAAFAENAATPEDQQAATRWRAAFERCIEDITQLRQEVNVGRVSTPEAAEALFNPCDTTLKTLRIEATRLAEQKLTLLPQSEANLNKISTDTQLLVGLITLLALILALAWSLLFPARLMQPINALQSATSRLTSGDLTVRVESNRTDELGLLAQSFNQMAAELAAAQKRLETWNQTLELNITEAQQARTAAEQASDLKSQFLANMSHELRTPLNSIINFTRILSSGMRGPVNEGQLDYLNRVRISGEHLLGLINDILDLSKIESGKMELYPERIEIGDIIHGVMSTAAGLTKDKPIELRQEIAANLPVVEADRVRLRQVLLNLLSNATKFTEQGSITVRAALEAGQIVVHVTDTGIGIAPEHLAKVFEEFRQVEGESNRRYEGTGLGLAICRRLIEMHGGRIWLKSTLGVGSIFSFSLPVMSITSVSAPTAPHKSSQRNGIPVLVIDDDPAAIEIAASYLGREGYAVYGLNDSRNVIAEARTIRPAVILLDVLMPHKDGWEVLAELKATPDLRTIPVALYTVAEEQKLGFSLGASAYMVKPVNADQLRTTVARLMAENSTVLIIDDDPNIRKVVTKHIQLSNAYRVVTADSGRAGLDHIAATPPNLIILDLMMPEVDGFAVLDELARQPHTRDIPVIVLTAKELTDQEREMLDHNADGLFTKGAASSEQLLNRVRTLLGPPTKPAAPVPEEKK